MAEDDPITIWLRQLREIDDTAASKLWSHYSARLRALARSQLPANVRRVYDEDDAALSAFYSLCRAIQEGRIADLNDRNDLWRLLVVITARKVIRRRKYECRQKRGGVQPTYSLFSETSGMNDMLGVPSREPSPEFAAEVVETCDALFDQLPEESLRTVAEKKMEGFTNREIAEQLDIGLRSVERKLSLIRGIWKTEVEDADP